MQSGWDGWMLYDFRRCNPMACRFLEIPNEALLTRRFFYWIPVEGSPVKIVSSVENPLKNLPGQEVIFHSWMELEQSLESVLKGTKQVAMEYSPRGAVPEVSRVDAGTVDLVRSFSQEVVSSGNLLQEFTAVWDEERWNMHQEAATVLEYIAEDAWQWIKHHLEENKEITEYDVQQRMLKEMHRHECITNHPPICAVNAHSSDPHYEPQKSSSALIQKGDWILIDLWCKRNCKRAVFADITRVAVAKKEPSQREQEIFDVVKKAQQTALDFVKQCYQQGHPFYGFEVDRVCRRIIETAGYGAYFVHRTGHNIDEEDHGPGAHLDDLETHDARQLLPGTCFSIEPGIYLKGEFGVRLEYDVYLNPDGKVTVTGGIQKEIKSLF